MLQSYLSNRQQIVKILNAQSTSQHITYGVPQGSILGPLLFIIYINNIHELGLSGDVTLYADDTSIFYFGEDIQQMFHKAQSDLDILITWFQYNLLTINVSKTNYMIFSAKNKKIPDCPMLYINKQSLSRVESEKYLGLILDSQITWKPHFEKIQSKVSALMGKLRHTVRCFSKSVCYTIYNSLVKSHLTYVIELWGSAAKTNLNQLQISQNKIIKLLFHLHYLTPTSVVYNKTGLMTIAQMYKYNTCILIRKILTKVIHTQIITYPTP